MNLKDIRFRLESASIRLRGWVFRIINLVFLGVFLAGIYVTSVGAQMGEQMHEGPREVHGITVDPMQIGEILLYPNEVIMGAGAIIMILGLVPFGRRMIGTSAPYHA